LQGFNATGLVVSGTVEMNRHAGGGHAAAEQQQAVPRFRSQITAKQQTCHMSHTAPHMQQPYQQSAAHLHQLCGFVGLLAHPAPAGVASLRDSPAGPAAANAATTQPGSAAAAAAASPAFACCCYCRCC
jgi:hypothetical protein